jgi:hypothetical protein
MLTTAAPQDAAALSWHPASAGRVLPEIHVPPVEFVVLVTEAVCVAIGPIRETPIKMEINPPIKFAIILCFNYYYSPPTIQLVKFKVYKDGLR